MFSALSLVRNLYSPPCSPYRASRKLLVFFSNRGTRYRTRERALKRDSVYDLPALASTKHDDNTNDFL
jgi:hypothetical protein